MAPHLVRAHPRAWAAAASPHPLVVVLAACCPHPGAPSPLRSLGAAFLPLALVVVASPLATWGALLHTCVALGLVVVVGAVG